MFMLQKLMFSQSSVPSRPYPMFLEKVNSHPTWLIACIGAVILPFSSWQIPSASAVSLTFEQPVPLKGAFLSEFVHHTSAIDLGNSIATNYAIYCQPQDIPQDRPICLGGIGGEVDTDVPPTEAASETNREMELAGQAIPLAQIELYQYDKVQIFPLR